MSIAVQEDEPRLSPARPMFPIYRLTVDQYHRMIAADILTEDDPIELLFGWLVPKMPKGQPHNITAGLVADTLARVLLEGWYIGREEPFVATDWSEPEPDVMVVRGSRRDYPETPPTGADLVLVFEAADSSLARDQSEKKEICAAAGVPVYWLANVPARRMEVYTDPTGPSAQPDYRAHVDYGLDDSLPLVIEGREIARFLVRDLFPAPRG
jgi:Uma2 family endonuclease